MSFIYLFDLIDFDKNGTVCQSGSCSLEQSRSNFLYLLGKYNQNFLKSQNLPIPAFFKEELAGVLRDVEDGKDYEKAKATVLSHCLPVVQELAKTSTSEKELVSKLNEKVALEDKEFADKFDKVVNKLQLEYIITSTLGKIYERTTKTLGQPNALGSVETKSPIFKDMIRYNGLVCAIEKVKSGQMPKTSQMAG